MKCMMREVTNDKFEVLDDPLKSVLKACLKYENPLRHSATGLKMVHTIQGGGGIQ